MPFLAGWERVTVRAVKGAVLAFIGAKRRPLTGEADGSGAGFQQEGQKSGTNVTNPDFEWGSLVVRRISETLAMKPDSFGGFFGWFHQLPDRFKQGRNLFVMSFDSLF